MSNDAMLQAWNKWTEPMLPEQYKGVVPVESLYFQAFEAGWKAAVDSQIGMLRYEVEALEQKLREEKQK